MTIGPARSKKSLILILLFFFVFSLRFIHLGADPPKSLDPTSIGHMSDPGGYVFNAHNKIVFGTWKIDQWNLMVITPLTNILTYLTFLTLGVGIAQMNILPVVFSCLILIFVYLILKRAADSTFALIGVLLVGINYPFLMFSRIAVRVMPMLFFVLLAVYLLIIAKQKKALFFLAGVTSFLTFTVKGVSLLILPSVVLGMLLYTLFQTKKDVRLTFRLFLYFAAGMAVVCAFWLFLFYFPHREMFQDVARDNFKWLTPHGFQQAFKNFWVRPLRYFVNMPIQASLSWIFMPFLFYTAVKSPKKLNVVYWILGFWLTTNFLYQSVIYYRPWRHAILLVLPISLTSLAALYEFSRVRFLHRPEKMSFSVYAFLFFWLIFPLSALVILRSRPGDLQSMARSSAFILGVSFVLTALIAALLKAWPRDFKIPLRPGFKTAVLILLVGISAFVNLRPYLRWVRSASYDIKYISQDLGKAYPKMSIAGLIAPLITLENQHRGHAYHTGYINKGLDFIQKYKITHLFLLTYFEEKRVYLRDFPEVMKRAHLIARYFLWRGYFEFYELSSKSVLENAKRDTYEGEQFFGEGGIPRFDPSASGRFAYVFDKNQNSSAEMPIESLSDGRYDMVFALKSSDQQPWKEEDRVSIVVADSKRKRILAQRTVNPGTAGPEKYREFRLPLTLKKPTDIELRIYKRGRFILWFDKVSVRRRKESSILQLPAVTGAEGENPSDFF
jgi:4-amino-4-deoxy-L-arabinose transferase-like glycosyltransferase